MQPHIDYMRSLASRFSGETNVPLSELGVVSDNPSSAEAIYAAKEALVVEAQNLNADNGEALAHVALMALAIKEGTTYAEQAARRLRICPKFRNPAMPSVVTQADAMLKDVQAVPLLAESDVLLEEPGFSDDQMQRLHSLIETIMRNAARDRKKGVRFARVPTGAETCACSLMLASRGAVYHSRKTAGEFRHFHRRCDCKVVPGFEDDPDAELVEGVRPKELHDHWLRFKEIDDRDGLADEERRLLKRFVASGGEVSFAAAKGVGAKARNEYVVHMPDGLESRFVTGSEITVKKVCAGNGSEPYKKLRIAGRLVEAYGGEEGEWFHVAGAGWIFDLSEDGKFMLADVHWMEHPELGKFEFYCKHWLKRRG